MLSLEQSMKDLAFNVSQMAANMPTAPRPVEAIPVANHTPQGNMTIMVPREEATGSIELSHGWTGLAHKNQYDDLPSIPEEDMPELKSDSDISDEEDMPELTSDSDSSDADDEQTASVQPKTKRRKRKRKKNQAGSNRPVENSTALPKSDLKSQSPSALSVFQLMVVLSSLQLPTPCAYGEANAGSMAEPRTQHQILLDTGCTDSSSGFLSWLTNRLPTFFKMKTANDGLSAASCKGTATLRGLQLQILHVPDFNRRPISWSDLDDMGMTFKSQKGSIQIYNPEGKLWTTVTRENDRLWHFSEVEKEEEQQL